MNKLSGGKTMRKVSHFSNFQALIALVLFSAVAGLAQNSTQSRFVVTAKAGGINYISGDVTTTLLNGNSRILLKGDNVSVGDRVSTGANSKAEVLLNPGSYVRLGANTEFEFVSTDLENVQIIVHKGSVIFEVFASNDFVVNVAGPDSRFIIVDSGVYRFDVNDQQSTFAVRRGRAHVGSLSGELLKGGRESAAADGQFQIAKFDRGETDELDEWSKDRSKELAKALASLDKNGMRAGLMNSFLGGRWNMFNSFGVWVYDPFRASYCFLPFGNGWSSPYGYGYNRFIGWYNLPPVIYYPPIAGGGTTPTQPPVTSIVRNNRNPSGGGPLPPFVQMQGNGGGGSRGIVNSNSPFDRNINTRARDTSPAPVFIPSAPPAATGARPQNGSRP